MSLDREPNADLSAYRHLTIGTRVLEAGAGGATVILEHAAVNQDEAFITIPGVSWEIDASGVGGYLEVTSFLRFKRWSTVGTIAGGPVAVIDIVAKS